MSPETGYEDNRCAYCKKPAGNDFVCAECIVERKMSVESIPAIEAPSSGSGSAAGRKPYKQPDPSIEVIKLLEENRGAGSTDREDDSTDDYQAGTRRHDLDPLSKVSRIIVPAGIEPWASGPIHADLRLTQLQHISIAAAILALLIAILWDISDRFIFGTGDSWPAAFLVALSIGWLVYLFSRAFWSRYASWVFDNGKKMRCDIELSPSGELDRPFIMVPERHVIASLYNTRVFSIQEGHPAVFGYDPRHPNKKWLFEAIASYDPDTKNNAVVFEVNGHRIWCRAVPRKRA